MRNLRNWWVTTHVDGRETCDATGPRGKDGGFSTHVKQRVHGEPKHVLSVHGSVREDGSLHLWVTNEHGEVVHTYDSER